MLLKVAKPVARSVAITRTREARASEHRRTIGVFHDAAAEMRPQLERPEPGVALRGAA